MQVRKFPKTSNAMNWRPVYADKGKSINCHLHRGCQAIPPSDRVIDTTASNMKLLTKQKQNNYSNFDKKN